MAFAVENVSAGEQAKVQVAKPEFKSPEPISEDAAMAKLARFGATYSTLEQWQQRAKTIRAGILKGAQLDPMPPKTPLNPIIHSKKVHDGYTVENAAFEALPGFYVTGNLYRPLNGGENQGSCAAVLCPHGHFQPENNDGGGRLRPDMQIRCAALARMGAVVFAYDMLGWGESKKLGYEHRQPKAVAVQTLSSIRAVDFLTSLPEVDPSRIGITGASGGGTQSILLAAVDDRVTVCVPVVMVSALYDGGCICESGMPIHKSATHETCNVEIAALMAPKPLMLISDGGDWTRYTPVLEFPYIRNIYRLYGAADNVENLHLYKEKHDYGRSKRLGMYPFMAKHLKLDLGRLLVNDKGEIDEGFVTIEPPAALEVFNADHPVPAAADTSKNDVIAKYFPK